MPSTRPDNTVLPTTPLPIGSLRPCQSRLDKNAHARWVGQGPQGPMGLVVLGRAWPAALFPWQRPRGAAWACKAPRPPAVGTGLVPVTSHQQSEKTPLRTNFFLATTVLLASAPAFGPLQGGRGRQGPGPCHHTGPTLPPPSLPGCLIHEGCALAIPQIVTTSSVEHRYPFLEAPPGTVMGPALVTPVLGPTLDSDHLPPLKYIHV